MEQVIAFKNKQSVYYKNVFLSFKFISYSWYVQGTLLDTGDTAVRNCNSPFSGAQHAQGTALSPLHIFA